jgi:hypothetical protein
MGGGGPEHETGLYGVGVSKMDGRMDGWTDGRVDQPTDQRTDGPTCYCGVVNFVFYLSCYSSPLSYKPTGPRHDREENHAPDCDP